MSHKVSLLVLAGLALLLLGSTAAHAQVLRVRVSVKVVLDAAGNRPTSGYVYQDSQIEEQFADANAILRSSGADWRIELTEIVDAPGISKWFGPLDENDDNLIFKIEAAAEANNALYLWREDAINHYIVDFGNYAWCSLPPTDDIILMSTVFHPNDPGRPYDPLDPNDPVCPFPADVPFSMGDVWLHEIGHYFNLWHTQGRGCGACGTGSGVCNTVPGDDEVANTLPDLDCWNADDIAQNSFRKPYAELSEDQHRQVDVALHNVMSYHNCEIYADTEAFLTTGQLARMAREMDPDIGRRTAVVYAPCEVGTVPGEVELDCNSNGILDSCEPDCNRNGIPDDCDRAAGSSHDCNANGAPDECELSPQGFGFGDRIRLQGGLRPNSILAADLDGDARADIVTADGGGNGFTTLFSVGGGAFSEPLFHDLGHRSRESAVLDHDGDGDIDLAIIEPGALNRAVSTVSVVPNLGDRTFGEPLHFDVGKRPGGIASADLDADGLTDLAVACNGSNEVYVLRNAGAGRFEASVIAIGGSPSSIAAADLDGDGDQDVVTLKIGVGTVALLFNQGGGNFAAPRDIDPGAGVEPGLAKVADLNADGPADICLADRSSLTAWVLQNDGSGSFRAPAAHAFSVNSFVSGLKDFVAADVNGDGRTDLVGLASSPSRAHVLLQGPKGGFVPGPTLSAFSATSLTAGDFTGDGFLDLALAQATTNDLSIILNLSSPPAIQDCDANGVPDSCDIARDATRDVDSNGVLDACERTRFLRGDPNASGTSDISDAIAIFGFLFLGDAAPGCKESADVNNDAQIDISDGIFLLTWLFAGGPAPAEPGPAGAPCGLDSDAPGSPGDLGCKSYRACHH